MAFLQHKRSGIAWTWLRSKTSRRCFPRSDQPRCVRTDHNDIDSTDGSPVARVPATRLNSSATGLSMAAKADSIGRLRARAMRRFVCRQMPVRLNSGRRTRVIFTVQPKEQDGSATSSAFKTDGSPRRSALRASSRHRHGRNSVDDARTENASSNARSASDTQNACNRRRSRGRAGPKLIRVSRGPATTGRRLAATLKIEESFPPDIPSVCRHIPSVIRRSPIARISGLDGTFETMPAGL